MSEIVIRYSRIANGEQVMLKAQDLLVLLKATCPNPGSKKWTYAELAHDLGLSASEVHAAVKRAFLSNLIHVESPRHWEPHVRNLQEFLLHGARYVFPPERGASVRGMRTSFSAPVFAGRIRNSTEVVPVWPDAEGDTRGESFEPLYPTVPHAARRDAELYARLALLDAIRGGAARERALGAEGLVRLLEGVSWTQAWR